jgi:hypothetical protein
MNAKLTIISRHILVASTALIFSGCGGGEKTTSTTTVSPDGTETVKVEETKDSKITTTRTVEPKTSSEDEAADDANHPKETTIDISTGKDDNGDTDKVHIRAPGVKIDSSDNDESVHIKLPFINIQKDGAGSKVRIKAPFVRVNTN